MKNFFSRPRPTYTFEIFSPRGSAALSGTCTTIDGPVSLSSDLISVTYGAGGTSRDNTLSVASFTQNYGILGVAHLTCVGSSKDQINRLLDELIEAGVPNVLALRGDLKSPSVLGDFKYAFDPVAHTKARGLPLRGFGACYPGVHRKAASAEADL